MRLSVTMFILTVLSLSLTIFSMVTNTGDPYVTVLITQCSMIGWVVSLVMEDKL